MHSYKHAIICQNRADIGPVLTRHGMFAENASNYVNCTQHCVRALLVRFWTRCPSVTLRWRHNDHDGVSNYQPHGCLLYRLFRRRSKKTSKLRVTGLCAGNSPGTGEFPAQMASYAENVSIWWRHHDAVVDVQATSTNLNATKSFQYLPQYDLHHCTTSLPWNLLS